LWGLHTIKDCIYVCEYCKCIVNSFIVYNGIWSRKRSGIPTVIDLLNCCSEEISALIAYFDSYKLDYSTTEYNKFHVIIYRYVLAVKIPNQDGKIVNSKHNLNQRGIYIHGRGVFISDYSKCSHHTKEQVGGLEIYSLLIDKYLFCDL
jgi:hypothetical protein